MPTSAGRYNPIFYSVIGTAALPFSGDAALYAMRATGGLLCAVLIALGAVTLRRWARTVWPGAALLLTATPMLTYSTTIAAPNGVEMAGALLVWCALLGLVETSVAGRDLRFFVLSATVGAVPLLVVRSLGPLWLLLICASILPLLTRAHLRRLLSSRYVRGSSALLTAVAVAAAGYTLAAGTNAITGATEHFGRPSPADLVGQIVLWFVQTVGTFPARDELAPMPFYAGAFLGLVGRHRGVLPSREPRSRAALLLVAGLATTVALAVTLSSWDAAGAIWQGRYAMPLTLGFALVCGRVMDRAATPAAAARVLILLGVAFTGLHAVAVLGVVRMFPSRGALAGTGLDDVAGPFIMALTVIGAVLLATGLRSAVDLTPSSTGWTGARRMCTARPGSGSAERFGDPHWPGRPLGYGSLSRASRNSG